ncbi:MAG: protein phosphatase 2C domain-containing protein [Candidatus Competibacteraceae bacterium]|nr:protein phosphatase 2C domain-containing protein [Candidatus Competibacteraceae bacterium]
MHIVTDSHFEIGKTHLVCEDYACHGEEPVPYVIVADGCSSASDADVGARLLALNARKLLPAFIRSDPNIPAAVHHRQLGHRVMQPAIEQAADLGLDSSTPDTTLIVAFVAEERIRVHVYGDGCLVGKRRDGTLRIVHIEFAQNAPYYLSYAEDWERQQAYGDIMSYQEIPQRVSTIDRGMVKAETRNFDEPGLFEFDLNEFPLVAIATDGLDSLTNVVSGVQLKLAEAANQFMTFENTNGDFVKRRLRRMLINYAKESIYNLDDVGCGVFACIDD